MKNDSQEAIICLPVDPGRIILKLWRPVILHISYSSFSTFKRQENIKIYFLKYTREGNQIQSSNMSSFVNADLGSDSDSDDGDFDPTKELGHEAVSEEENSGDDENPSASQR